MRSLPPNLVALTAVVLTAVPASAAFPFHRTHHRSHHGIRHAHRAVVSPTVTVQKMATGSITVRALYTAVVPGHVVPGRVTPPHMVGGAHPHVVPGHVTPAHLTAPHTRVVNQTGTFDISPDVAVRVAGRSGKGALSDVAPGANVRLTIRPATATARATVTEITVLSPVAARPN